MLLENLANDIENWKRNKCIYKISRSHMLGGMWMFCCCAFQDVVFLFGRPSSWTSTLKFDTPVLIFIPWIIQRVTLSRSGKTSSRFFAAYCVINIEPFFWLQFWSWRTSSKKPSVGTTPLNVSRPAWIPNDLRSFRSRPMPSGLAAKAPLGERKKVGGVFPLDFAVYILFYFWDLTSLTLCCIFFAV